MRDFFLSQALRKRKRKRKRERDFLESISSNRRNARNLMMHSTELRKGV